MQIFWPGKNKLANIKPRKLGKVLRAPALLGYKMCVLCTYLLSCAASPFEVYPRLLTSGRPFGIYLAQGHPVTMGNGLTTVWSPVRLKSDKSMSSEA